MQHTPLAIILDKLLGSPEIISWIMKLVISLFWMNRVSLFIGLSFLRKVQISFFPVSRDFPIDGLSHFPILVPLYNTYHERYSKMKIREHRLISLLEDTPRIVHVCYSQPERLTPFSIVRLLLKKVCSWPNADYSRLLPWYYSSIPFPTYQ